MVGLKSIAEIFRSYGVVDSDGKHVNGTDKETNHHYGDAYEDLFIDGDDIVEIHRNGIGRRLDSCRSKIQLIMEVGIADGSSLLAWSEVFPNATCIGVDIHHSDRAHGNHIEFYRGDQRSKEDCERAAGGRLFDMIVEDALHQLDATLQTLLYLWPSIKPGGVYVVEEFANIGALRDNISALWPFAQVIDTVGPFGGVEPLVVFRKPI